MPSSLIHFHLNQHITREELAFALPLLATTHFNNFFGWYKNLAERLFHVRALNTFLQRPFYVLFKAGIGMNHIPTLRHLQPQPSTDDAGYSPAKKSVQRPQNERHNDNDQHHYACRLRG